MPTIRRTIENPRLFTDEDPLELELPNFGKVRLADFYVNPPVEDDVSPETKPLTYLVDYIMGAIHPDVTDEDVKKVRESLVDALESNQITVTWLGELLGDITQAYSKAFEAAVSKASGRPTKRRGR